VYQVAGWWDGFELWVAGLPFIPQFLVVLIGMMPVSFAIACLLDRVLRAGLQVLGRNDDPALVPVVLPEPVAPAVEMREAVQSGAR
jgi:hypothetical protein